MMTNEATPDTVTQFVLFRTPLPALAFKPMWTPFARHYLDKGLGSIQLYQRDGDAVAGDAAILPACRGEVRPVLWSRAWPT